MKILVTGAAGFIAFHLLNRLIAEGNEIVGIDNISDFGNLKLKHARLAATGIDIAKLQDGDCKQSSSLYSNYHFVKCDIVDKEQLHHLFESEKFTHVVHLAAKAGVRESIDNPQIYIDSNITGFLNILECCKDAEIEHLIYASSSSVYGNSTKTPFSESENVDKPVSIYAATKKSNELMAYTYSHLYNFKTTGLRFFTVYGPWGRHDMAPVLFAKSILKGEPIKVFNGGDLERDFTYVADIVDGIYRVILNKRSTKIDENYNIYNIGNSTPVRLLDFIESIEKGVGQKSKRILYPMQDGDVARTHSDVTKLQDDFGYNPTTSLDEGVQRFASWFLENHKLYD